MAAYRTDEELLPLVRQGDEEAEAELYARYKLLVRAKARSFFLVGGDQEDLIQEGMLGCYKAVLEYDAAKNSSFRSFAELCITRQILSAIKTATRKKHGPLNSYVSLDRPAYGEDDETSLMNTVSGMHADPEELLISQETVQQLLQKLQERLSKLERQVLGLYLQGLSQPQIAQVVNKPIKSVSNALQRIKHKLESHS